MTGDDRGTLGRELADTQEQANSLARVACWFLLDGKDDLAREMATQYRAAMDRVDAIREQIKALR